MKGIQTVFETLDESKHSHALSIVTSNFLFKNVKYLIFLTVGRDNSVGIATHCGLNGPGIFPHPPRPSLGPTQPPIRWVPGLSRGVKWPGRDVDHPPPSSAEVKERVQLYLYFPSGFPWPVLG